jgi:hypothetical protein
VSVLDDYVAGLAGALRGPRRLRCDLIAEARDSLVDASEAYQAQGAVVEAAQRRAVAEFGSYGEVLPGYQAELAVAQARRTTVAFAAALVALRWLAPLLWPGRPVSGGAGLLLVADGFGYLALAGAGAALAARLLLGWGSRFAPDGARVVRAVGRVGLGFLALHGLVGLTVYLWSLARWPAFLASPPVWAGLALTNVAFACAVAGAWRCLSLSRAPHPPVTA